MRSFDGIQLDSLDLFCKAAEHSSFSAAAEVLGVTPASVSRAIGRLENRLGVRLFVRTTRSVRLSREGQLYWRECRQALEQLLEAERLVTGQQKVPSGVLRITVGTLYANYRLIPLLPLFHARYPQIEIELSTANRVVDLVEEDFDLAIRLGEPADSRLIAHRLEDAPVGVFAAPAYLQRRGEPRTLAELDEHDCIEFVLPSSGRPMAWNFRNSDGQPLDRLPVGRTRVLDDPLGCITLTLAGGGLYQLYHFIAEPLVQRGELVEVLQPYAGRSRPFSLLYPQNRHLSARVRAFVAFLRETLPPV